MTWINWANSADWNIYANVYIFLDNYFFKWDKSFVKIVSVTNTTKTIQVNDQNYTVYSAGEELIIEVTDFVRASAIGMQQYIEINYLTFDYTINFFAINGARGNEFKPKLPAEIPFNTASANPFYVQFIENMETLRRDNGYTRAYYVVWNDSGGVESWDWRDEYVTYKAALWVKTSSTTFYTNFINKSCWTDKILVEWMSAQGQKKSWWFLVDGVIYGNDKTLNLQTLENGYTTLKNKRVSVRVKHLNADNTTQNYLSDIAMSDEVYVYENDSTAKLRVRLADNAFEVTQGKRDIQLMINKYAYDTI